jgi:hypothetical protein
MSVISIYRKNEKYTYCTHLESVREKRAILSQGRGDSDITEYSPEGTDLTFTWIDSGTVQFIVKYKDVDLEKKTNISKENLVDVLNYYTGLSTKSLNDLKIKNSLPKDKLMCNYFTIDATLNVLVYEEIKDFKNRNDIILVFERQFYKRTPHNTFFKYFQLNEKYQRLDKIDFEIFGLSVQLENNKETWLYYNNSSQTKMLEFLIEDKLKNFDSIKLVSVGEDWLGFRKLVDYMKDICRVGTHQGLVEIKELQSDLNNKDSRLSTYVSLAENRKSEIEILKEEKRKLKEELKHLEKLNIQKEA